MSRQRMCVVNSELVEEIAPLVGSQAEIMTRVGISWNSWVKISGGLPVRVSVGERLRSRVLERAEDLPGLRDKFPPAGDGQVDREALERAFLKPVVLESA